MRTERQRRAPARPVAPALAALLALASAPGLAQAQTVHWYESNFPPYSIIEGPDAGKGISDQAVLLLMKRMPEFHSSHETAALPRVIDLIKTGPDACSAPLVKTPQREEVMDFAAPYVQLLPNGIVVLRKHAASFEPYLNERSELRLDDVLASGKFKLGLSPGRSYGPVLDAVLAKHAASTVVSHSTDLFSSRLLKLSTQDEFDAIIGYAIELTYTVRHEHLNGQDFVIYPIAESSGLLRWRWPVRSRSRAGGSCRRSIARWPIRTSSVNSRRSTGLGSMTARRFITTACCRPSKRASEHPPPKWSSVVPI
jgi:uncharacterized protein (TIGR02285 family)